MEKVIKVAGAQEHSWYRRVLLAGRTGVDVPGLADSIFQRWPPPYVPSDVLFCHMILPFPPQELKSHYSTWAWPSWLTWPIECGRSDSLGLLGQDCKEPCSFYLGLREGSLWGCSLQEFCCYPKKALGPVESPWVGTWEAPELSAVNTNTSHVTFQLNWTSR